MVFQVPSAVWSPILRSRRLCKELNCYLAAGWVVDCQCAYFSCLKYLGILSSPSELVGPGVGFWRQRAVMAIVAFCQGVLQKGGGLYRYTEGSTCLSILYLVLGLVASWGIDLDSVTAFPTLSGCQCQRLALPSQNTHVSVLASEFRVARRRWGNRPPSRQRTLTWG